MGDPGATRTRDPQIRNLVLYPTELRDHFVLKIIADGLIILSAGCKLIYCFDVQGKQGGNYWLHFRACGRRVLFFAIFIAKRGWDGAIFFGDGDGIVAVQPA